MTTRTCRLRALSVVLPLLVAGQLVLGGEVATIGDEPWNDAIRVGVAVDTPPADADARVSEVLGVPARVVQEALPSPA